VGGDVKYWPNASFHGILDWSGIRDEAKEDNITKAYTK
jgi:hypothetical protein